jgi:ribonucleotide reductase beta subunit family protein with ferritin-like domain
MTDNQEFIMCDICHIFPCVCSQNITTQEKITKITNLCLDNFDEEEEKRKDKEEELLNEKNYRLAIKPIDNKYKTLWDIYKKYVEAFWTPEMVDFNQDQYDFQKLDPNIQHFIKMVLAFFAGADSIVIENIDSNFTKITVREALVAYSFQESIENIHGEVYADMLINIITNSVERDELINAFKTVPSIKQMIGWGRKWISSKRRLAFSMVAFTIFEGLMFSGAFASIYWLKKILGEDKMKGLVQSNNYIAKDEGMHTTFGFEIYKHIVHKLSNDEMYSIINEAVEISKSFTIDAIKVELIGMNVKLMNKYIEYVADRILVGLGYEKLYNTTIPDQFQFMETIGFLNKDNFFERRSTDYQLAHNSDNKANWEFNTIDNY